MRAFVAWRIPVQNGIKLKATMTGLCMGNPVEITRGEMDGLWCFHRSDQAQGNTSGSLSGISAIFTGIFGPLTFWQYGSFDFWLKVKLVFVFGLYFYHYFCHRIYKANQNGQIAISSFHLRLYNELATVFLVVIVCLAVFKDSLTLKGSLILASILIGLLGLAVYIFRHRSKKN